MKPLNPKQLGEYLGYSVRTIHNLRRRGMPAHKPPGTREYRFYQDEVDKWMRRQ